MVLEYVQRKFDHADIQYSVKTHEPVYYTHEGASAAQAQFETALVRARAYLLKTTLND